MQNLYEKINLEKGLSNTDILAIERNILANERTFLAYCRTFLSFFVAGVSLIRFFEYKSLVITGYLLIPVSLIVFIFGLKQYLKNKKIIAKIKID